MKKMYVFKIPNRSSLHILGVAVIATTLREVMLYLSARFNQYHLSIKVTKEHLIDTIQLGKESDQMLGDVIFSDETLLRGPWSS